MVRSINIDGNNIELDICDELYDCTYLDVSKAPLMVTVCRIGDQCVIDPNTAEEQCSVGSVVVAVANGKFTTLMQVGGGSLYPKTLIECAKLGQEVAQQLNKALLETLNECKTQKESGFLK